MKPDVSTARVDRLRDMIQQTFTPFHPAPRFGMERGDQAKYEAVGGNAQVVEKTHLVKILLIFVKDI